MDRLDDLQRQVVENHFDFDDAYTKDQLGLDEEMFEEILNEALAILKGELDP